MALGWGGVSLFIRVSPVNVLSLRGVSELFLSVVVPCAFISCAIGSFNKIFGVVLIFLKLLFFWGVLGEPVKNEELAMKGTSSKFTSLGIFSAPNNSC